MHFTESVIDEIEKLGRIRAKRNDDVFLERIGTSAPDTFLDKSSGCDIGNPWLSSCGRFEVDPYKEYGRPFVTWLFRPLFGETRHEQESSEQEGSASETTLGS